MTSRNSRLPAIHYTKININIQKRKCYVPIYTVPLFVCKYYIWQT
jgi:hypothetical protein